MSELPENAQDAYRKLAGHMGYGLQTWLEAWEILDDELYLAPSVEVFKYGWKRYIEEKGRPVSPIEYARHIAATPPDFPVAECLDYPPEGRR